MVRTLMVATALALLVPLTRADEEKKVEKKEVKIEKKEVKVDTPLDRDFLLAVAQRNTNCRNCVVVFEKLASSDKVKEFAKTVASDHNDLQSDIAKAFKERKIGVVATPDKASINKLNELRKADKGDRDKLFLDQLIDESERLLTMAEHQKAKGKADDANEVAKKMIPVLKKHLEKAKELKKDLK
jgi:predicted outer membrane protein